MTATPVDEQKKAAYTKPEMAGLRLVLDDVFLMNVSSTSCGDFQTEEMFGLDDF